MTQPLGVAALRGADAHILQHTLPEHWYWCRRHKQTHKVGEKCEVGVDCPQCGKHVAGPAGELTTPGNYIHMCGAKFTIPEPTDCVDIGPFMSEIEANRLAGRYALLRPIDYAPLGMEIE